MLLPSAPANPDDFLRRCDHRCHGIKCCCRCHRPRSGRIVCRSMTASTTRRILLPEQTSNARLSLLKSLQCPCPAMPGVPPENHSGWPTSLRRAVRIHGSPVEQSFQTIRPRRLMPLRYSHGTSASVDFFFRRCFGSVCSFVSPSDLISEETRFHCVRHSGQIKTGQVAPSAIRSLWVRTNPYRPFTLIATIAQTRTAMTVVERLSQSFLSNRVDSKTTISIVHSQLRPQLHNGLEIHSPPTRLRQKRTLRTAGALPPQAVIRISEALDHLIELNTILNKPEGVKKHSDLRAAYPKVEGARK